MAELKPGGLAMFIAGPSEILGIHVETLRYVIPGESVTLPNGLRIRNGGKGRWLIHNERLSVMLESGEVLDDYLLCPGNWLIPLDDDFSYEEERSKELTHG